jgi:hypothetical protein
MQTLTTTDSIPRALRAARRHLRLARRAGHPEALALAERIQAPLEALKAKHQARLEAATAVEDAYDDWTQDDGALDRAVRSVQRRCLGYDAEHPGAGTAALLFRGLTASEVTYAPRDREPDLVAAIVARGAELPADHPAAPQLPELTALADASRAAHRRYVDVAQRRVAAAAEADLARVALIRAYRDNAIDIERAVGKAFAESCFPLLRGPGARPSYAASDGDDA